MLHGQAGFLWRAWSGPLSGEMADRIAVCILDVDPGGQVGKTGIRRVQETVGRAAPVEGGFWVGGFWVGVGWVGGCVGGWEGGGGRGGDGTKYRTSGPPIRTRGHCSMEDFFV